MKISYNWLKWYIPDLPALLNNRGQAGVPDVDKLRDVFTYHLCEVESVEKREDGDVIFDINILPNRAHDLLSHLGVARELASLLDIKFNDPTPKYKLPESRPTGLKIEIASDKCRRYMGRIVRGVKVGPSPDWVKAHLEAIGQRSINNMVDAANLVMFNCGQPTHVFDLKKVKEKLVVRQAREGEDMTTLDNKELKLGPANMVIADGERVLALAGIKGGKIAEVDESTSDVILEVANFDPVSVRKTAQTQNIFTDARKRFENDLSPELAEYGMRELSALIYEMCPGAVFEDIVDVYPKKQPEHKLTFSAEKISKILGLEVSKEEIEGILKRYNFPYKIVSPDKGAEGVLFEIIVPPLRLDLVIEEDMAEEIGRILGYDRVKGEIPKIEFEPKANNTYAKICWARNKLLEEGYSEVMTYVFRDKGDVEVLASASDKKHLRTNLADGLKESLKLNMLNAPLLDAEEIKIFEIGTVFLKDKEEARVAYGDKKGIKEMTLDEFCKDASPDAFLQVLGSPAQDSLEERAQPDHSEKHTGSAFRPWSLFPFIARDIALWVPSGVEVSKVEKVIKENTGEMVIKGPTLFDSFTKGDKTSYAFRLVFQSYERTLTDQEVNAVMEKIKAKLEENSGWRVR